MSQVDYEMTAEDHHGFLVIVRAVEGGQQNTKVFNKAWERIRRLWSVQIPGHDRTMWIRYKRTYSHEDNNWGDFQAHRKVLGLVAVAFCSSHNEFSSIFDDYKELKEGYSSTLYNSRLIVFGMNRDGSPCDADGVTKRLSDALLSHYSETVRVGERFVNVRNVPPSPPDKTRQSEPRNDITSQLDPDNVTSQTNPDDNITNQSYPDDNPTSQSNPDHDIVSQSDPVNTPLMCDDVFETLCDTLPERTLDDLIPNGLPNSNDVLTAYKSDNQTSDIHTTVPTVERLDEVFVEESKLSRCDDHPLCCDADSIGCDDEISNQAKLVKHPLDPIIYPLDDKNLSLDRPGDRASDCSIVSTDMLSIPCDVVGNEELPHDDVPGVTTKNAFKDSDKVRRTLNGVDGTPEGMRTRTKSLLKESTGSEIVFYPKLESAGSDLEERMREFLTSLFFVLESKRLGRSFEKGDKTQLLCTPFEKRDFVGIDTDSRAYKRRCQGRLRKRVADLSLQAGLPGEAILHYQTALDTLKPVNDWFWIGACLEGLCCASVILNDPIAELSPLKRNLSFNITQGSDFGGDAKKHNAATNMADDVVNALWSSKPRIDVDMEEIIQKYRDAIACYSKYKAGGTIEIEASLKACKVLVVLKKFISAAEFLQNVVYINSDLTDDDKIEKYSTLSLLYTQIGFYRKAAFYTRIAAMQCVAPLVDKAQWLQCYNLLLQALPGYGISLDPKEFRQNKNRGWPVTQLRVLNELVFTARKMGNTQLAIRHLTFVMHTMRHHQDAAEVKESVALLESLTATVPGSPHPLALDSGVILPPVPLTSLPILKSFRPLPLAPHLQPVKLYPKSRPAAVESHSPFIYSPFAKNDVKKKKRTSKMDFCWSLGEVCEIDVQLVNPLSEELKIDHIGLLWEGVTVETFPTSPVLPAQSGPCLVKLVCSCKKTGTLVISGYSTEVLGVRSHCRLKDITDVEDDVISVDVVPPLSQIQVTTSLPKAVGFFPSSESGANVVTSATAALFVGQTEKFLVTVYNVGPVPVQLLEVFLQSKLQSDVSSVVSWKPDSYTSQLPMAQSSSVCFTVELRGQGSFLSQLSYDGSEGSDSTSTHTANSSTLDVLLVVQHSGGEGLVAGYCRQSCVALTVDVQPSLRFTRAVALPHTGRDKCFLVLDAGNVSGHELTITYSQSQSLRFQPSQSRRFMVVANRLDFDDLDDDADRTLFSERIAETVDIRWSILDIQASGTASISQLTWSQAHINVIRRSPVHCEMWVNGRSNDEEGVRVSVDDLVTIYVKVTLNRSRLKGAESGYAVLSIHVLPVVTSAMSRDTKDESSSQECVLFLGSPCTSISLLVSEECVHECSVVFTHCGLYTLTVNYDHLTTPAQPLTLSHATPPYLVTVED